MHPIPIQFGALHTVVFHPSKPLDSPTRQTIFQAARKGVGKEGELKVVRPKTEEERQQEVWFQTRKVTGGYGDKYGFYTQRDLKQLGIKDPAAIPFTKEDHKIAQQISALKASNAAFANLEHHIDISMPGTMEPASSWEGDAFLRAVEQGQVTPAKRRPVRKKKN